MIEINISGIQFDEHNSVIELTLTYYYKWEIKRIQSAEYCKIQSFFQ
jgi:hypothetical protein